MKLSPFFFLVILCFFVIPCNAAVWDGWSDMAGIGQYEKPPGVTADRSNYFAFGNSTNIYYSNYELNSASKMINALPDEVSDVHVTSEYVYVVLRDGRAYRLNHYLSVRDFNDYVLSGDNADGKYLGDFSNENAASCRIIADESGDIFISSAVPDQIIKIDGGTLTSVTYASNLQAAAAVNPMFVGSNDILFYRSTSSSTTEIGKINSPNNYEKIVSVNSHAASYPNSISQLTNGNYIIVTDWETAGDVYIAEYNDTSLVGVIFSGPQTADLGADPDSLDMVVLQNGVIVLNCILNDNLITFTTYSGAGGFTTSESGLTAPTLTYAKKDISSEYPTYYNMSSILINWNIAIREENIGIGNSYATKDQLLNAYDWQFELWSPDDVSISTYKISDSSFKWESSILGIIGTGDLISIGGAKYPNINMNGTWQVRLYERNTIQGTKALLDTYSFEIQDLSNPFGSAEVVPTDTSGETAAYNFLNSPYLVAIIVIGIVGFQFGRGRDGNINGTAMIVLIPLAVGLCCLMGILPLWILYVMVLCIIAFVAVKMSTGGS